jgi:uncharacterized protein DUF3352
MTDESRTDRPGDASTPAGSDTPAGTGPSSPQEPPASPTTPEAAASPTTPPAQQSSPPASAPAWAPTTTYGGPGDAPTTAWAPPPAAPAGEERVVRRTSRGRWAVALLASGLVVAILVGLVVFLGGPAPSGAPAYLPGSTYLYGEARLDLPGSQRQKMAQFLSHFPGFKDQATFDRKIDETLDRVLREATKGRYTYTGDVKPWFGGQIAFALTGTPTTGTTNVPAVLALNVIDHAKAEAAFARLREDAKTAGVTLRSEEYRGVTIWTIDSSAPRPAGAPATAEVALTNDALLISAQSGGIKAALDRKQGAGDSLGKSTDFSEALKGVRDDRLALIYIGTKSLKASIEQQIGTSTPGSQFLRDSLKNIPDQFAGSARVEADRIVFEARSKIAADAKPALKESTLAGKVPSSSLVFIETRDVGQGLGRLITQLKSDPQLKQSAPQLEQVELALGNKLESYLDWLGDVAIVGEAQNGRPTGGLVATVSNEEVAKQRLGQLTQLLRLGGTQAGGQIAVSEEDHGGIKITRIAIATDGAFDFGGQRIEDIEIAFAFKQGIFVLGPPDYVTRILDLPAGQTLAGSDRFKDAIAATGATQTAGLSYVDLAGLRSAAESLIPSDNRARYDQEVKPYLEPLDRMVSATLVEGDALVNRAIFIVK